MENAHLCVVLDLKYKRVLILIQQMLPREHVGTLQQVPIHLLTKQNLSPAIHFPANQQNGRHGQLLHQPQSVMEQAAPVQRRVTMERPALRIEYVLPATMEQSVSDQVIILLLILRIVPI